MLLKELIEFHRSIAIPRDKTNINYDIPYLHYADIYKLYNCKLYLLTEFDTITKVKNSYYDVKYQIDNNDIIINLTLENYSDLGKSIIITNRENIKFIAGMEAHLIKIKSNKVLADYLNYYFQSNNFKSTIQQYITGMKVFRVKPNDILKINFNIQECYIQKNIVDIMEVTIC